MSDTDLQDFDARLHRIAQNAARQPACGRDPAQTRAAASRFRRRPALRLTMLVLAVLVTFKGFMLASLGGASYLLRVQALSEGSGFERLGAFVMSVDPVSLAAATWLSPLVP